jgi:hypothetical protein
MRALIAIVVLLASPLLAQRVGPGSLTQNQNNISQTLPAPTGGAAGPAVAFDSKFEKGANSQASPFSFVSNAGTVTGTVGNNANRVLIGYVAFRTLVTEPSAVAMTWNSVSMTQIGSKVNFGGSPYAIWVFGLIAPATGAQTISTSWTGGNVDSVALGAVSLYNGDQTTGWQNSGSDTGTSTAPSSSVTTANGNAVVVCHGNDNASSTVINQGTSAWIEGALNGNYAMAYKLSTTTPETVSWTLGSSVAWGNFKVDVIKAP